RSSCVDDVGCLDRIFLGGNTVTQASAGNTAVAAGNFQHLSMVADHCACCRAFRQPLSYKPLRKFALRVFIAVDGPRIAVIKLALKRAEVVCPFVLAAGPAMVKPQAGPDGQ